MITMDREFVEYAEKEMTSCVLNYSNQIEFSKANSIAKDIVKLIDWNNSALMHKGLSWIAKNYMLQNKII